MAGHVTAARSSARFGKWFVGICCLCALCLYPGGDILARAQETPTISAKEWAAFKERDPGLRSADTALNSAYRQIVRSLSPGEKNRLVLEQRGWINERNQKALQAHARNTPEYFSALAALTRDREEVLRARFTHVFQKDPQPVAVRPEETSAPTPARKDNAVPPKLQKQEHLATQPAAPAQDLKEAPVPAAKAPEPVRSQPGAGTLSSLAAYDTVLDGFITPPASARQSVKLKQAAHVPPTAGAPEAEKNAPPIPPLGSYSTRLR